MGHMAVENLIESFFEMYNIVGTYVYGFYLNNSRAILDVLHNSFDLVFRILIYLLAVLGLFYFYMAVTISLKKKKAKEHPLPEGKEPFVTVQIPTYNELVALNCARRCLEFDYPKDRYEIIIGDDSRDKRVSARIDGFAREHSSMVKITRRGNNIGFKPGNLNHMLKCTNGEFIVIFDSDFLPENDFLRRIIAPFMKDKSISVVQARWSLRNFGQNLFSILGGTITLISHQIALPFITARKGNAFLCGSAEAIRKKTLDELGGWQPGALTEDIECTLRLMKNNKKLVYLEDLQCECEAPHTLRDLCRQQMRWAYGVIAAIKMHFFDILRLKKNDRANTNDKANVLIFASGYLFTLILLSVIVFGMLSFISNRPGPIDWYKFLSETALNVAISSCFLLASIIALAMGRKVAKIPKMIASSFSVGFVVTYYVNMGMAKALFNREMQWFMLKKNGNRDIKSQ